MKQLREHIKKEIVKFNDYGLVALGMDTTMLNTQINNLIN